MDDHTSDPTVTGPGRENPARWLSGAGRWEHDALRRATVHGVRL